MKPTFRLILSILIFLGAAAGSYWWATNLMDSVYNYRSPLRDNPPPPGQPLGNPLSQRVIFVLIDGLRLDTSLQPQVMPYLADLRSQGAWAVMHSMPPSYSQVGYATLLIGAWPDINDAPPINLDYPDIYTFTQDDLVSAVQRAGLRSAVSAYNWFEKLIPRDAVSAAHYTSGEDHQADLQVLDAAFPWIDSRAYHFVLIHIDQIDYAGHYEGGPVDPRWDQAASRADELLRQIVSRLDLTQDTVLVASDHGHIDRGGHGGHDAVTLIEPFLLVGAGVIPGVYNDVYMVDVAPTLAALLGSNLPASSQGRVLTEMLTLHPEQENRIREAEVLQQEALLEAYLTAIDQHASVEPQGDSVAAYQAALESVRSERLNSERLLRAFLAVGLVVLLTAILYLKPPPNLIWMVIGALIFIALFNLRYLVLGNWTYSLSSVPSADDLILFTATSALIALLVTWLVISIKLRTFLHSPLQAALTTTHLIYVTIFLLLLPVLWSFTLNGATITWTLPDFSSMFIAFISLMQILVVSAVGILLIALSALISRVLLLFQARN
ncbi:MAG: alkaline phosphatase family protein [Anaerolineales bacterium]